MSEQKCESSEFTTIAETGLYIKYLERELAQARKLEEVGMLAGVVAHDLNNILTPIFGYSTILKRDLEQGHPLAKAVGVIEKSAERAALLVGNLLGCSRQQETIIIPFDIVGMLEKYLEHLNGALISIEKNLPEVPAVLGDPHQIALTIRLVAENAIEAMEQKGTLSVTVESVALDTGFCRYHPPAKPGQYVCIALKDTGHGMAPDVLEKVFDPFYSTKPNAACSGTGLTIAQSLMKKNSGCMELESTEGVGTTVKIYLPAA